MRTIIFINHVFSTIIFWGTLFVDKHKDQNLGRFKLIFIGYPQNILDIGNEWTLWGLVMLKRDIKHMDWRSLQSRVIWFTGSKVNFNNIGPWLTQSGQKCTLTNRNELMDGETYQPPNMDDYDDLPPRNGPQKLWLVGCIISWWQALSSWKRSVTRSRQNFRWATQSISGASFADQPGGSIHFFDA